MAARSDNVPMSGLLLAKNALKLAKELATSLKKKLKTLKGVPRPLSGDNLKLEQQLAKLEIFKASEGWLDRFKHRHSIVFKSNQEEAAEIDLEKLGNWQQNVLLESLVQYSAYNICNVDETGLFWQLLPNKTPAFKGESCSSGKKSKERITVLVGANMSGTVKLPLLVIGKSAKPRAFKGKEVPYKANRKAWMTGPSR